MSRLEEQDKRDCSRDLLTLEENKSLGRLSAPKQVRDETERFIVKKYGHPRGLTDMKQIMGWLQGDIYVPQCKKDGCKQPAVLGGKLYCVAHKMEYDNRRNEYERVRRTLPFCAECGNRITKPRADEDHGICLACEENHEVEEAKAQAREAFKQNSDHEQIMRLYDALVEYGIEP